MPVRWILCRVITEPHPDGGVVRYPRIAQLPDSGDPEAGPSSFSCVMRDGVNVAVCFVRYKNPAHLDAEAALDATFVNVLERDYEDAENFLALTPRQAGWNNPKTNRVRNILQNRGVDVSGLTVDTPLWEWMKALGSGIRSGWEPKGTWAG